MSQPNYIQRIETARDGTNPTVICPVPSGWVFLANMQYLRDMALVGDALLEMTNAYRINYATLGNTEPVLHSHIVPRYLEEPDEFRAHGPWSYPQEHQASIIFDLERDRELMERICAAIQKRH